VTIGRNLEFFSCHPDPDERRDLAIIKASRSLTLFGMTINKLSCTERIRIGFSTVAFKLL